MSELTSMGAIIDSLGVKAELAGGEQVTDVIVLAKVAHPDDEVGPRLEVLFSPGTDAITRIGLYHAAADAVGGYYIDEEDDL